MLVRMWRKGKKRPQITNAGEYVEKREKRPQITNAGEYVEKREHLHSVGGNVK